ncbi:DUF4442 domain-containing protein [Pseudomonas sp. zfem005]|uniref:DUF4442 domain-containing protein n=1 Tax=Pseudomonas sp. zfem005 TaxID=3078200 RepID=UPI0029279407|nr:DUF4442 domain-containing protein [Pseudomonas sp. zfem005]MDU9416008.1 DUF4442 domain-containing protein [Pseudomonas sp. zfem005]
MPANRLSRATSLVGKLPAALHTPLLSLLIGSQVRFAGTARVRVHHLSQQRAVMSLANRPRVRNHIKGVHAAAMALLAESATGLLVGMNVPDDKLPLIKSLHVDYLKRATGGLKAVAQLDAEQVRRIHEEDRGEVRVAVAITDETGIEPIRCEMIWAWVSRKREH